MQFAVSIRNFPQHLDQLHTFIMVEVLLDLPGEAINFDRTVNRRRRGIDQGRHLRGIEREPCLQHGRHTRALFRVKPTVEAGRLDQQGRRREPKLFVVVPTVG